MLAFLLVLSLPIGMSEMQISPRKRAWWWLVLGAGLALLGCEQPQTDPSAPKKIVETATSGSIVIAVDETYEPIIRQEAEAFMAEYPKAKIRLISLPGEDAINRMLASDSVRLVVAARTLRPDEEQVLKSQQTSLKRATIASDGVAAIIPRVNKDSVLTVDQFKAILTGKITSWKQINPRSPLGDIELIFDNGNSSTYQYLRDSLLNGATISPAKVFAAGTNLKVLEAMSKKPNAIGVIGLPWISDEDNSQMVFRKDIRTIGFKMPDATCKLSNEYEFFQPYQATIYYGCYPLSRKMQTLLREPKMGLGTGFVSYLVGPAGQRIIRLNGLATAYGIARVVRFPQKEGSTPIPRPKGGK